ncbi:putative permease [Rhodobacteraceae bacterium THAF1]|uniref:permease n=1 Tax=Palleronia sp. THAF1 TaxID=2587842 RepID=UPI000F3EB8EF|nr:permease [Palleronia sp. THAF1]QFU07207.1 putative permease [Palleronia sp. THAF1]VDC20930.1 putative permease [Rhodobacteraceae bacterium THAF1]
MIQVFVTRQQMQDTMGTDGPKAVALGSFFGFVSLSCSFAALSGARALFAKGAGLVPSMAFLLASTNLVVELGIIIAIFLGWQFVVGEYVGGVLLILLMWLVIRLTGRVAPIDEARENARESQEAEESGSDDDRRIGAKLRSVETWGAVATRYFMEWQMVWKNVTVGFTVAGIIAAFVPRAFFEWLFIGGDDPNFLELAAQALVGPVAAFFTFIGSMGNIPLAAVLYGNGVAFAGIMAFIFSDLVVIPVLRVNAKYYGWKMAIYILGVFLVVLVVTALLLHYGFAALGMLPSADQVQAVTDREFFKIDYTFWLNTAFVAVSAVFVGWKIKRSGFETSLGKGFLEKLLFGLALLSYTWLAIGLFVV